jgi:hypothetical protein
MISSTFCFVCPALNSEQRLSLIPSLVSLSLHYFVLIFCHFYLFFPIVFRQPKVAVFLVSSNLCLWGAVDHKVAICVDFDTNGPFCPYWCRV